MKKIARIMFTALLCLVMPMTVSAASDGIASGNGWTLDENGTLTITEELDSTELLWSEYSTQVRKVVLNDAAAPFVWDGMFADCTVLEEIVLAEETRWAEVRDGVLFGSGGELRCYPAAKPDTDYIIPEDCTLICGRAFAGAGNLKSVTLPENMMSIVDYTFENCTSLSSVSQAGGELTIFFAENAFAGCTSMAPAFVERYCWDEPFFDVTPQTEYFEGIRYVYEEGLMNGVSAAHFAPDSPMTRAMFVTVLGRKTGVDKLAAASVTFSDVEEGQWYTDAVHWAAIWGLVEGYGDGTFGINDPVTIEQAAVILARYARSGGVSYDMESRYIDTDDISDWAKGAMSWVTYEGIYTGVDGELRPKENASRAVVAQMLYKMPPVYQR